MQIKTYRHVPTQFFCIVGTYNTVYIFTNANTQYFQAGSLIKRLRHINLQDFELQKQVGISQILSFFSVCTIHFELIRN